MNDLSNIHCLHCGEKPEWKERSFQTYEGYPDSTNHYMWLECSCGIRTVEREVTYDLEKHQEELLDIFVNICFPCIVSLKRCEINLKEKQEE